MRISTLSGRVASSMVSSSASASVYLSSSTRSSTCLPHGFIRKTQIELPSVEAAVRSTGVDTAYTGAFAEGEGINNRKEDSDGAGLGRSKS